MVTWSTTFLQARMTIQISVRSVLRCSGDGLEMAFERLQISSSIGFWRKLLL